MRTESAFVDWALTLSRCAAAVSNYCDHSEHNEIADGAWVATAAREMRAVACGIAAEVGTDLQSLYAERLRTIERKNVYWTFDALDGGSLVEEARTWRDLQLAQMQHDRYYHPDVAGLAKFDQLRHYALHASKLAGAAAEVAQGLQSRSNFERRRLADTMLFGIKLDTVCGKRLPETSIADSRSALIPA